ANGSGTIEPAPDLAEVLVPRVCPFHDAADRQDLHSFPTRRSSDLTAAVGGESNIKADLENNIIKKTQAYKNDKIVYLDGPLWYLDRKSTRLNSSHVKISYAVFCLKKKRSTR